MEGRKEMFYLTMHSTHFIYGYMASDMVKDHSAREETHCRHKGYSFQLKNNSHGMCYPVWDGAYKRTLG